MKTEMFVERTNTGNPAYAAKYPVYSVGIFLEELKTNIAEVLNFHFEKECKIFNENDLKITGYLP